MISVIFNCAKRLSLTKMILMRFLDVLEWDMEFVLVYDGQDENYLRELRKIIIPDVEIINYRGISQGELFNAALDRSNGDYYMHMENDWWWFNNHCVDEGMYALKKFEDVDIIRLVALPYGYGSGDGCVKLLDTYMWEINPRQHMSFHFNPQLRYEKFVGGRYLDASNQRGPDLESAMFERWQKEYSDKGSWVLVDKYEKPSIRHIGFFSASGQAFSNAPKTLREIYDYSFYGGTFHDLNLHGEYRELFEQYLKEGLEAKTKLRSRIGT